MEFRQLGGALDAARISGDLSAGRISKLSAGGSDQAEVAAQEFESLFATLLVTELRKGLGDGFFGEGPGADTFNGWFDEQLGASIASRGSLGLADQVREAIASEQAAATAAQEEKQQEKQQEAEQR